MSTLNLNLNLISWRGDAALASPRNHLLLGATRGYGSQIRLFSRKRVVVPSPIRIINKSSPRVFAGLGRVGIARTTTRRSDESEITILPPPWLMLPPEPASDDMIHYKFYSIEQNKVLSVDNRAAAELPLPYENAEFVGCSHGWLALIDNRNYSHVFLFNPLSGRNLKLPQITKPECNNNNNNKTKKKTNIILTCSPEEEEDECRAVMLSGGELACCWPGHSKEWNEIICLFTPSDYKSVAYSPTQKLLFCINSADKMEAWYLLDNDRGPLGIDIDTVIRKGPEVVDDGRAFDAPSSPIEGLIRHLKFLVIAENTDQIFLVEHLVLERLGPMGAYLFSEEDDTLGFDVFKYDPENMEFNYLPMLHNSLGGLSFFIGINHGFAMPATTDNYLEPDCIYFAGTRTRRRPDTHDVGIFSYDEGIIEPCYYPFDAGTISPSPMWFTPNTTWAL